MQTGEVEENIRVRPLTTRLIQVRPGSPTNTGSFSTSCWYLIISWWRFNAAGFPFKQISRPRCCWTPAGRTELISDWSLHQEHSHQPPASKSSWFNECLAPSRSCEAENTPTHEDSYCVQEVSSCFSRQRESPLPVQSSGRAAGVCVCVCVCVCAVTV